MFRHEFACDCCSATAAYHHTIGLYRFPDGTEISRNDQPAWCTDCDTLRSAECIPDRSRLFQIIAELESGEMGGANALSAQSSTDDQVIDVDAAIQKWRSVLRWVDGRQAGPRCLTCQSTKITLLNAGNKESLDSFEHVGCGGTFKVTNWCHSSDPCPLILNTEGRPIGTEASNDTGLAD